MRGNDEIYVAARETLLDALEALQPHSDSLTLIGAQAIYLQVGDIEDLAIPPFTTDADLAIDPTLLHDRPPLERLMLGAGFERSNPDSPGIWTRTQRAELDDIQRRITVDLLVPDRVSGSQGRRGARLTGHDAQAARNVVGIEGTLVDFDLRRIDSLAADQARSTDLRVAGNAGLLVAKLHKIRDRIGKPRSKDKDALDVLRLLRGTPLEELTQRYQRLLSDPRSREIALEGIAFLREDFATPSGAGLDQLRRAVNQLTDVEQLVASCRILANRLVQNLVTLVDRSRLAREADE